MTNTILKNSPPRSRIPVTWATVIAPNPHKIDNKQNDVKNAQAVSTCIEIFVQIAQFPRLLCSQISSYFKSLLYDTS